MNEIEELKKQIKSLLVINQIAVEALETIVIKKFMPDPPHERAKQALTKIAQLKGGEG